MPCPKMHIPWSGSLPSTWWPVHRFLSMINEGPRGEHHFLRVFSFVLGGVPLGPTIPYIARLPHPRWPVNGTLIFHSHSIPLRPFLRAMAYISHALLPPSSIICPYTLWFITPHLSLMILINDIRPPISLWQPDENNHKHIPPFIIDRRTLPLPPWCLNNFPPTLTALIKKYINLRPSIHLQPNSYWVKGPIRTCMAPP